MMSKLIHVKLARLNLKDVINAMKMQLNVNFVF